MLFFSTAVQTTVSSALSCEVDRLGELIDKLENKVCELVGVCKSIVFVKRI